MFGIASKRPSLFADLGIHRTDFLTQLRLNSGVSDSPAGALQRHFDHRAFGTRRGLNRLGLLGSIGRKARELSLAKLFMQFALRLVLFPQSRSIVASKPRPLVVPMCFPPLLIFTGYESAEASFQCCLRETAINRARFDTYQRAPMSKDKAVCAKIKPDTVSVSDPVKLFPNLSE